MLLCAALIALGGLLTATALADHGVQKWSGQWNFVHLGDDGEPNGVSGLFSLRHETDARGRELLTAVGGTACAEATDYFAGAYVVPAEAPYNDTGSFRGCTQNSQSVLVGRYTSDNAGGDSGDFRLTLNGSDKWDGTYTVDGKTATYKWRGTFKRHFADGADEPSQNGSTDTPEVCAAQRTTGASPGEECAFDVTWRLRVKGEPTAGRIPRDLLSVALTGNGRSRGLLPRRLSTPDATSVGVVDYGAAYVISDDTEMRFAIGGRGIYDKKTLAVGFEVVDSTDESCPEGTTGSLAVHDGGPAGKDRVVISVCKRKWIWTQGRGATVNTVVREIRP